MLDSRFYVGCFLAALLACPQEVLARGSGIQITRDGKRTLISKDVGDERWAITLNGEDGSITGNVFHRDGGAPQFVWCGRTGATDTTVELACKGSDACASDECGPEVWTTLGPVTLPRSFLEPSTGGALTTGIAESDDVATAAANRGSGIQWSPDGKLRTLINKDVGAQRWAITRNAGDHTVTGNVFSGDDSPPSFLWCEERGGGSARLQRLGCWAAPPCDAAPCSPEQWTFVADVDVPLDFLGLATCADVSGEWRYSEEGHVHCVSSAADLDETFRFGGAGNASITQDGCSVAVDVSAQGASWTMRGAVTGDAISVSGPADVLLEDDSGIEIPPGVSIGGSWTWDGNAGGDDFELESSGNITASYAGRRILSCSVEGTHEFRR